MGKLMLAFASFWVRICLKICKGTEIEELRKLIKPIVEKLSELEKDERSKITLSKKTSTIEIASKAIKQYLDSKANSLSPIDWIEIIRCDITTEAQLIKIAKECINLRYYYSDSKSEKTQLEVAIALCENPNVTPDVMVELRKSSYMRVVDVGQQWFENHLKNSELKDNDNAMRRMMEYLDNQALSLEPDKWIAVAKCEFATETHLVQVAKNCVGLDDKENTEKQVKIAQLLEKNSQTTVAVIEELKTSKNKKVSEIVERWVKEHME